MADKKKKKQTTPKIYLVEDLAKEARIKPWELAGLRQYMQWPEGKQVTTADFNKALDAFRKRPQGGAR